MTHRRTVIRNDIVTLVTGLPSTGARVFASRMAPQDALPCLLVATNDEQIDAVSVGPLDRLLSISVTGYAKGGATLDDVLDQIAAEVEGALCAAGYVLRQIEVDFDDSLERPVGSVRLNFETLYFTPAGNPGVSA